MRRGEVRWARLAPVEGHEQQGTRPVLIVSDDRFTMARKLAIAFPLTTNSRLGLPLAVEIPSLQQRRSFALPGQVRTLALTRLGAVIVLATEAEVEACLTAMLHVCGRRPPLVAQNDS